MSSRVQKGNTVFKPVAKTRARPVAPRQESVALEPFAESSTIRKLPSLTPRPEQPPAVVTPSPAPTTNDGRAFSESQAAVSATNIIPAVITSRLPPPVLMQRTSATKQAVDVPADLPFPEPLTIQLTNLNQKTADVPATNFPSHFPSPATPPLFMPTPSPPLSPNLGEGSSTIRETTNKTRKSNENEKESKRRKTYNRGEEKTSERRRSPSEPRSSNAPRSRRRGPSATPFDPDADPGEDIDPTAVTMASLCVDIGQGRISTKAAEIVNNHTAWKLKNREKRARMKSIMESKKYGRPDDDAEDLPEKPDQTEEPQPSISFTNVPSSTAAAITDDTGNGFDYSQDLTTSRYNVQVRIGPNGETMIDEDSLVVDRTESQGTENFTHVTESDYTKFVNSATYGKRFRGSRWSAEETELFYDALSQYGENYELIAYILPGRDRKACKNKFKAEDKKNPARISFCLDNRIPVDISTLSRMTGKDFTGPVPEIRAPQQPQPIVPTGSEQVEEAEAATSNEGSSKKVKKKSRSQNQVISDKDVIVVGGVDDLQDL